MSKKPMKMNAETKRLLAGMIPMVEGRGYSFSPKEFDSLDESIRPVFTIVPLNSQEAKEMRLHLVDTVRLSSKETSDEDKKIIRERFEDDLGQRITTKSLIGWRNIYDLETGDEVPFSRENVNIPESLLSILFKELVSISGIVPKDLPKELETVIEAVTEEQQKEELSGERNTQLVLSEIERLGITIVALRRAGAIESYDCSSCMKTKGLPESRNCDAIESDKVVFFDDLTGELTACPIRFVGSVITEMFDRFDYYTRFPATAPKYEEVNPRFWEAIKLYDNLYYQIMKRKKDDAPKKDDFNSIRSRWG